MQKNNDDTPETKIANSQKAGSRRRRNPNETLSNTTSKGIQDDDLCRWGDDGGRNI